MTTRLAGADTVFLPFNQGDDGGAGNPPNPERPPHRLPVGARCGRATAGWRSSAATWWRSATTRSSSRAVIFPRYHQLDATRQAGGGRAGATGRAAST